MAKAFFIPALVVSFVAVILLLLCTISTPTTLSDSTPFDFVRAHDLDGIRDITPGANSDRLIGGIKFGTWGYCTARNGTGSYACYKTGHGYRVDLATAGGNNNNDASRNENSIKASWTRGLAVHVVAFVVAIVGFALSFFPSLLLQLIAFITHFLAALLALIAFAIDIVLYIYAKRKIHSVAPNSNVMPGPAFYMTLISIPLLVFAGLTVCCGRRKDKEGSAYVSGSNYTPAAPYEGNNYSTTTQQTSESYPMKKSSAQKVMDAFHSSKA
ncbi:pali-domain-containing protein [Violaceomyces palustris]|uniref:Pali-domain-containing protein n=1 Tax=Violaceomyces palustris TaxID=1673888 RepID=A0ACD0P111_9BASI|nr:pali-domain-containing protein [Violaceomyces palustris]